jgi:CheY-like chemotaxis protein
MNEQSVAHLLVVEDDAAFRRFVVRALESGGFRVTAAENFAAAIKVIEQGDRVDLLISDVGLGPGEPHGIALGNMAQLRRSHLKIIYITGSYDPQLVNQYGAPTAVLQKPFTAETLIAAVTAALTKPIAPGE